MFKAKNIDVIRIGLQNTDTITDPNNESSEVIAGPYHPAFGQLVESAMWYDAIVSKIKKLNVKVKEVEVTVNPIDVNNVIGHKKVNVEKLKDLYDVDLIVKQDDEIKQGKSQIIITKTYTDFLEEPEEVDKQKLKIKK
jgi:transcription antitermination factor NusA-like protein